MDRREFAKRFGSVGIGLPFLPGLMAGCSGSDLFTAPFETTFSGKVLIVGAGAAGLTAGYILNRHGIDFEIIEASSVFGGRVKEIRGFADFPIDLGGEWIHTDPSVLTRLANDQDAGASIEVIRYSPESISTWSNGKLHRRNWAGAFYSEYKFKSTTWFSFFDRFIVPEIRDRIVYDSPVTEIDYRADNVLVRTADGVREADKVLVTIPISVLQTGSVTFTPALSSDRVAALNDLEIPDILKVFIEFSERFYPDLVIAGGGLLDSGATDKLYYDAAFRKDSNRHVLGLFVIGEAATVYANLPDEARIVETIMGELDAMFDGAASRTYLKHVVQDWTKEPYIRGSYTQDEPAEILGRPLDDKVFFAGEAFAEDWSTVHGAGLSAYSAVEEMLTT